jgi:hypothetical protein
MGEQKCSDCKEFIKQWNETERSECELRHIKSRNLGKWGNIQKVGRRRGTKIRRDWEEEEEKRLRRNSGTK